MNKNNFNWLIPLSFIVVFSFLIKDLSAQDIKISSIIENININQDSSYIKEVNIFIDESDKIIEYPIIFDTELEVFSDLKLYIKKGKKYKFEKQPAIYEQEVNSEFITSKKIKYVLIPPLSKAKITYKIACNQLIYLSSLNFFSENQIDTLCYNLSIPDDFNLSYNIVCRDSLDFFEFDTIEMDQIKKWKIKTTPIKVKPNLLALFGIYKNLEVPFMRMIVVPHSFKGNEKEYMNYWYFNELQRCRGIDSIMTKKVDDLTKDITDSIEILNVIYDYVKNNFKYVAIEIGMGAFIPTHSNQVFHDKHGDCKDLSNLLSELLNYKHIKSDVALAATYDYISDCNYPSLSSANHVICVAYINNDTILLDPTDPLHIPYTPVQSILERTVFIINSNNGTFYTVKSLAPARNEIAHEFILDVQTKSGLMKGSFISLYKNTSSNYLKRHLIELGNQEGISVLHKHFETILNNQTITNFDLTDTDTSVIVKGDFSIKGKLFSDLNRKLLFVDFVPKLIESEMRDQMLKGTYLGNKINKKVRIKFLFDDDFEPFKPISFSEKSDSLDLNILVSPLNSRTILYEYDFTLNHIYITNENVVPINHVINSFNKFINEPIVLKRKIN